MSRITRKASVVWQGDYLGGKGAITTESGSLGDSPFFSTGHTTGIGTTPDELIAAAVAICFAMDLANELGKAGFTPHRIEATAMATMEKLPSGWTMTGLRLDVVASVPKATQSDFIPAAIHAKTHCWSIRLLNTNIAMSARLENSACAADP